MSRPSKPRAPAVDYAALSRAMKDKREKEGLTLRDVERASGISYDHVGYVEAGRATYLGAEVYVRCCLWLGVPFETFMVGRTPGEFVRSTPDEIEAAIHADAALSPDTKRALAEMMRCAYRAMAAPEANAL